MVNVSCIICFIGSDAGGYYRLNVDFAAHIGTTDMYPLSDDYYIMSYAVRYVYLSY